MNSKHLRALRAVFKDPVSAGSAWADIEGLLVSAECEALEGAGSRVRFVMNGEIETFHRPHPAKEAKRYQIRAARDYLIRLGVRP